MAGSSRLVHIVDEVPGLESSEPLVLVVALHGFLDSGDCGAIATAHLATEPGPVVATFDVDQFHDYRARRPLISFTEDHFENYEAPRLVVRLQTDEVGEHYLLLTGPEPDNRWEAFVRAVRRVIERFNVRLVVSLGSVPMAVPHTRPLTVTQHANRADLLLKRNQWRGEMRIPSSAQSLLEVRLGEAGHSMTGYVVHVPHYLAQMEFSSGALALLQGVEDSTGLSFDLDLLKVAAEASDRDIASHVEASPELVELLRGLEQQYDTFDRAEQEGGLLASDQPIPTGDELGEQFERFLAGLDDDGQN